MGKLYINTANNGLLLRGNYLNLQSVGGLVDFLLIGGGGTGALGVSAKGGGGGGGGGYIFLTGQTISPNSYPVVIGDSDQNTTFNGNTALAGGRGDSGDGGCGGGANGGTIVAQGGTGSQGYNGGGSINTGAGAGGGGGIGSEGDPGGVGSINQGGNGGAGMQFPIFGTNYYAGGAGGGGSFIGTGQHGGGNGANNSTDSTAGAANTGGGGGGGKQASYDPKPGGSGIFKIRYITTEWGNCSGGTKTTDGIYTIHTFTSSGTLILV